MIEVLDPFVCRICICSGELSTVPYEENDPGIYSVSVAGERESVEGKGKPVQRSPPKSSETKKTY